MVGRVANVIASFQTRDHSEDSMTSQYIRLMLLVLVVVLMGPILKVVIDQGEWEHSISDYFHTSARLALVASLLGIGVCMMALYSSNKYENFLLNFSGVVGPIIGFAATTQDGRKPLDFDVSTDHVNKLATTTLPAYFAALLILATFVFVVHPGRTEGDRKKRRIKGFGTVGVILLVALVTWVAWHNWPRQVHSGAAFAFFAPLVALTFVKGAAEGRGWLRRVYFSIGTLMVLSAVGYIIDRCTREWDHATLLVEIVLVSLFAVYWIVDYLQVRRELS